MHKIFQRKEMDMLHGSLVDKILIFALPLAASSILQQLFNSADVAVVGRFAGSEALAAVGANGPVITLLVNLFVGLSVGANVAISMFLGRKDNESVERAVHTAVVLAVLSGIVLLFIGVFLAKPILTAMAVPGDIMHLAVRYLRIYFCGMPFIMLYNFEASILRSKGDTARPLFTLMISGVANVVMNLFFVVVLHMNVEGVAIATVLSNVISSMILLYFLIHEQGAFRLQKEKLHLHMDIVKMAAKIGIPAGLQGVVFSLSNVIIQSGLNSLGPDVMAGSAAAVNYEVFAYFLLSSFSQAAVTFIGQNYGAKNYERCKKAARDCWMLSAIFIVIMCGIFLLFARPFASIFSSEPAVIELAVMRMHFILIFELLNMSIEVLSGCMRGLGRSLVPALICVLGICGVRVIWVYTGFAVNRTFMSLLVSYPLSWVVTTVAIVIAYFCLRKRLLGAKEIVS